MQFLRYMLMGQHPGGPTPWGANTLGGQHPGGPTPWGAHPLGGPPPWGANTLGGTNLGGQTPGGPTPWGPTPWGPKAHYSWRRSQTGQCGKSMRHRFLCTTQPNSQG